MITAFTAALAMAPTSVWYGPATASFNIQFPGNPYDPAVNDVRVMFVPEKGTPVERLAFFDGSAGTYKSVLVAQEPGTYRAVLLRNGKQMSDRPEEKTIELKAPLPHGFIRRDAAEANRLRWDDGTPYYPVGMNLGWEAAEIKMTDQIDKMSKAGMNWSRIWACPWDGKNPWWPQEKQVVSPGQLWVPALERWQELVDRCDKDGLPFQLVLFHHGLFSSTVNPNWPDHPWNAKNGGFLKDPADFFTDPEAKRRTKMWLRYAVARYASSPSIMAWELFNEVQWTDCWKSDRRPEVFAWHKEMADYIRGIDPYKHLVTTSSDTSEKGLWEAMDVIEPHTYPVDIPSSLASEPIPTDKPMFFGEFGPEGPSDVRRAIRDGIFAAMALNHAGAAQFWSWDVVEKQNLYDEWTKAAKALELSDLADHPGAHPLNLTVSSQSTADLTIAPALGWAPSTKTAYDLQLGAKPVLSGMSSYLQGTGHPEMQPGFPTFRFTAAKPGAFRVRIGQISKGGAHVRLLVDGKLVAEKDFPGGQSESFANATLEGPFGAGAHTVVVENTGADWASVSSFTVTGFGPAATNMAVGDGAMSMVRLTSASGVSKPTLKVGGVPLNDGAQAAKLLNLEDGTVSDVTLNVKSSAILDFAMPSDDVVLFMKR